MTKKNGWNPIPFEGPQSYCKCGHTGDGVGSQHEDQYAPGHGPCKKCSCKRFTWDEWTPEFAKHHNLK